MKFAYLIEPPFNHRTPDGRVTGSDVELARRVLSIAGVDAFEPVETEFAQLLPGVAAGRWRMTTGLFATEERRATAAFSRPIWALPDGLLVRRGDAAALPGYGAVAATGARLAVIRDQFQHRTAVAHGVADDRLLVMETYGDAAAAVADGRADAYASVGRAHTGYLAENPALDLDVAIVPASEKAPDFGAFAFAIGDDLRPRVDEALAAFLGSADHRALMATFGFTDEEVDLVAATG